MPYVSPNIVYPANISIDIEMKYKQTIFQWHKHNIFRFRKFPKNKLIALINHEEHTFTIRQHLLYKNERKVYATPSIHFHIRLRSHLLSGIDLHRHRVHRGGCVFISHPPITTFFLAFPRRRRRRPSLPPTYSHTHTHKQTYIPSMHTISRVTSLADRCEFCVALCEQTSSISLKPLEGNAPTDLADIELFVKEKTVHLHTSSFV